MGTWRPVTLTPNDGWGPLPPHATPPPRPAVLRWLERALLVIGIVCLGYYGYVSAESALYQAYETRELDAILASAPPALPASRALPAPPAPRALPAPPATRKALKAGDAVGRIEIPRLGVSAVVRAGSD